MKRIHLLCTEAEPDAVAGLIGAARAEGLRVGWLDLEAAAPGPVPPSLEAATDAGALRAVSAGGGRTVAVKRSAGPWVLRDLLREHFLGCALVVVRPAGEGAVDLGEIPVLEPSGDGWRIVAEGTVLELTTGELVARLRRPRLTGSPRRRAD